MNHAKTPSSTKAKAAGPVLKLPPTTVQFLDLRPLSATSFLHLIRTRNAFFVTGAGSDSPAPNVSDSEMLFHLMAFVYIHTAPLEEVVRATRQDETAFEDAVDAWSANIPFASLPGIIEQTSVLITAAQEEAAKAK